MGISPKTLDIVGGPVVLQRPKYPKKQPKYQISPQWHPTWYKRSIVPPIWRANPNWVSGPYIEQRALLEGVERQLGAWSVHDYPGKRRLFLGALCRPVTWAAVGMWLRGQRRLPKDIAEGLSDLMKRRGEAMLDLAERLGEYAQGCPAPRAKSLGFRAVDEKTGRDKRHRVGNKPKGSGEDKSSPWVLS